MRNKLEESIQHSANIAFHDRLYSMIVDVFNARNIFYQHSVNRLIDRIKPLESMVSGCKGNSPTEESRQRILLRYDSIIESVMIQYTLALNNFKSFEIHEIRHTLEVVTQYLQSSRAHFFDLSYIDAHLRMSDAVQYMEKAVIAADLLTPVNSDPIS
ncbi:hypothetical protein F4212_13115 [Candidatus Poribacteria bacterium]|nr:hypothetical protein [Candidatus Poribacteria bacterium]